MTSPILNTQQITTIVLDSIRTINMSRDEATQVEVSPNARLYGRDSKLDSLGLVSLVIEVEEQLRDQGVDVSLSDERAMSRQRSPYRDVPSLVSFIEESVSAKNA